MKLRYAIAAISAVGIVAVSTGAALASPTSGVSVSAAAKRAPQVQICTGNPATECMNRGGGSTSHGGHVIAYNPGNANNDFTFVHYTNFVCGVYDTVHNGESGCVGPFTNGSGLNARYDGHIVYYLNAYDEDNDCVAIPSFTSGLLALGGCTDNGTAWVVGGPGSWGVYVISVGESNWIYGQLGTANNPQFMHDHGGIPTQMWTSPLGDQTWGCRGSGIGSC